jgi:hypothetical protein
MRLIAPVWWIAAVVIVTAAPSFGRDALPLTVVLKFERAQPVVRLPVLRDELQTLLGESNIQIDLRGEEELEDASVRGGLVVFRMKGQCTANALPVGAVSDERGPLAMTYSTDGQLLHFGEVECDRIRQSLERLWGKTWKDERQAAYSTALARVMAHEIYHMMGNCVAHTKQGLTRESLSAHDLTRSTPPLSVKALDTLRAGTCSPDIR